jgi:hypothetical protein
MDSSLTVEKVELATVTRDDASGKVSSSNTARQQMLVCMPFQLLQMPPAHFLHAVMSHGPM